MTDITTFDPDLEWLDHVQPVGLVVASSLLKELGLAPQQQTQRDSAEVAALLSDTDDEATGPLLRDPWAFFSRILGWEAPLVAGAPSGPAIPDALSRHLPEYETTLSTTWAVRAAGKDAEGWQLLVRVEEPGIAPDDRNALEGWEATPHQRFERLLRETGVEAGILVSDAQIRLVYAPKGETSGWLSFPLRPLTTVAGRPMLGGLKLMLHRFRLFNAEEARRLPALLKSSREAQAHVSTQLSEQVLGALHELLRGLTAADPDLVRELARSRSHHLYEGLLTVLMRLVFVLYAEDRDLIPSRSDAEARDLYQQGYGVRTLHGKLLEDAARNPDTMEERRGAWGRLLATFRLIYQGDMTAQWVRARGGKLFDPQAFPFLEGRRGPSEPAQVLKVTDGCVLRVLDGLLTLKGERLSYRTLDVEQIGSVYETVMGFTVELAQGPSLAIRAGKNNRTPVFVQLDTLMAAKGTDRLKQVKEAGRTSLTAKQQAAVKAAKTLEELAQALDGIVDERASPQKRVAAPGTPLLQPTDERRRTGSHYTPRSLTLPIVLHALQPAFDRLGPDATPDQVLDLKVCDPAMGSGAFLVEACRQLATRLVAAWARWPQTRPLIPADEDEELHARRLVAQRCLYGVDRNPMATDLARLSLWLATLARDHEFTFLDHALKTGDSLVGLTRDQIAHLHWNIDKAGLTLFRQQVDERFRAALDMRAEIRNAPDNVTLATQEQRHRRVEQRMEEARAVGDAIIGAFFSAEKPKDRERARQEVETAVFGNSDLFWAKAQQFQATLRQGENPIRPFHWELEFPEVFARPDPGFDAMVGNPPFAGKNTIAAGNRAGYGEWLQTLHPQSHGNADLVAHFFRRAGSLIRKVGSAFGLIATNTIGQGDTRETGLARLLKAGGSIFRAIRRLKWPGEAAVVVSVVHFAWAKMAQAVLDNKLVSRISAYLMEGDRDDTPARLAANAGKAFQGPIVLGTGFTFDDAAAAKGAAMSIEQMHSLIEKNPINAKIIRPYIGGDEINSHPEHMNHRYVINFGDIPLRRDESISGWYKMTNEEQLKKLRDGIVPSDYPGAVAEDWPDMLYVVQKFVKPQRDKLSGNADAERRRRNWWRWGRTTPALQSAIEQMRHVMVNASKASPHHALVLIKNEYVFSQNLNVFCFSEMEIFSNLSSRVHEVWARFIGTTMKEDFTYGVSDCFGSFPIFNRNQHRISLNEAGQAYNSHRAGLMLMRNEGLTKTYNRFHDPEEMSADIVKLRELHDAMDHAVLAAYGWDDLIPLAVPQFLTEENEGDPKYQKRYFWPADVRDEVLARLLKLNAERAAAEKAAGLVVQADTDEESEEAEE